MTYRIVPVSDGWEKVLKSGVPIAWIKAGRRSPPESGSGFPPGVPVYVVHRHSERARDKRGERVGERGDRRAAFDLAVDRCG